MQVPTSSNALRILKKSAIENGNISKARNIYKHDNPNKVI